MNIHQDPFKNKYFLIITGIIVLFVIIIYFVNYNSLESKCRRKYGLTSQVFHPNNKLQELQLEKTTELLVQDCIKNEGK